MSAPKSLTERDLKRHKRHNTPSKQSIALMLAPAILAALCAPLGAQAASQSTISGTASVIDGDTIEIHGNRIRLHAIDAIESRQKCLLPNGTKWRYGTVS